MKLKTLIIALATIFALSYTSCKKSEATTETAAITLENSTNQAISDNMVEDANDVFTEAADQNDLMGNAPVQIEQPYNLTSCAIVTVSGTSFPKTITINFGSGCTSTNGVIRKGKIIIVLSDSVRKSGSTAVMTFDGYYVNGYKQEGTLTWTNTSTGVRGQTGYVRSWSRKMENGKTTAPDGRYWLHHGLKNVVQIEGVYTHIIGDDIFSITGTHTVTNAQGISHTSTIQEPLIRRMGCRWIVKGSIKMQGPNHYALLDFGAGECDNKATISVDGGTPKEIILP
ncbi:hypothetical protein BH09BAC2_BH09BAC2_07690 [soil metagenome]